MSCVVVDVSVLFCAQVSELVVHDLASGSISPYNSISLIKNSKGSATTTYAYEMTRI
jgi:hypothetical protein